MRTFDLLTYQEISHELGQRCRRLRLQANLSELELAGRSGASLSSIRRLEADGQADGAPAMTSAITCTD